MGGGPQASPRHRRKLRRKHELAADDALGTPIASEARGERRRHHRDQAAAAHYDEPELADGSVDDLRRKKKKRRKRIEGHTPPEEMPVPLQPTLEDAGMGKLKKRRTEVALVASREHKASK